MKSYYCFYLADCGLYKLWNIKTWNLFKASNQTVLFQHCLISVMKCFLLQSEVFGMILCHNVSCFLLYWERCASHMICGFFKAHFLKLLLFSLKKGRANILEVFFVLVQARTSGTQPSWLRNGCLEETWVLWVALTGQMGLGGPGAAWTLW